MIFEQLNPALAFRNKLEYDMLSFCRFLCKDLVAFRASISHVTMSTVHCTKCLVLALNVCKRNPRQFAFHW